MPTVTLDTNVLPADDILSKGRLRGYSFAVVSVSQREVKDSSFTTFIEHLNKVPETGVWGESRYGEAVFASEKGPVELEDILEVIAGGSFPKGCSELTNGQRRQLRDAMILEAHSREGRDILVSNDRKAFVAHGRRRRLEGLCHTRILTGEEFRRHLDEGE